MRVLLIDIDSKIPNLALKKIEKYYLDKGWEVSWNAPIESFISDKIYVSCIFTKNRDKCKEWEGRAEIGGSGYDLYKTLPEEIDQIKPRINWGFTTRGCIRNCEFCIVPKKEGKLHIVGDIYDIWDGKSKNLILMDNNILGLSNHFKNICSQIRKEKIRVDFNQGLDIRLVTDDIIQELNTIKHLEYKFSWDLDDDNIIEKLKYIRNNIGRCTIFVICGYPEDNYDSCLRKFNILREIGHNGYCMRYEKVYSIKKYITLARWVNQHHIFKTHNFEQFLEKLKKYE